MRRKSGAECATNHCSGFNKEGPAFHEKSRAFCFFKDAQKDQPSHPPNPGAPRRAVPRARPQQAKQAEVEVKVKRRTGSCVLNLSLSLNLPRPLADFFSILLKNHRPLRTIAERAMVTHIRSK